MKKILILAVVGLFIISCGGNEESTMTVSGKVKGLKKGMLYLQKIPDSTLVTIDSVEIADDESFTFTTELESPEIYYLYLNKDDNNEINDRIIFFGEPGIITINTSWNTFDLNAKIEGSETHKRLEEYQDMMSKFNSKSLDYLQAIFDPKIKNDSVAMDSIQKLKDLNTLGEYRYAINFALFNKNSCIAPYIALKEVPNANIKFLDSINNSLAPDVANSKYGKALNDYLEKLKTK